MAKIFSTSGTGASQVLNEADNNKLKVYDDFEDIDTTALADGEIVSTKENEAGGNVYDYIDKQIADAVEDAQSYSTEETLTGGTWIDGKPIYRKVVTNLSVSILSSMTWTNICSQSLFPNSETLVSCDVMTNNGIFMRAAESIFENGNLRIETSIGGQRSIQTVIVEYTKTTD
jgi:hypothetical protein